MKFKMLANEVSNAAVDAEYGVHHTLHHIDADMPPEVKFNKNK